MYVDVPRTECDAGLNQQAAITFDQVSGEGSCNRAAHRFNLLRLEMTASACAQLPSTAQP